MKSLIKVFTSWRMAVVFLMGFCSGLPLALTGGTLQAWLTSANVSLPKIGFFSAVSLPYVLKVFLAPMMDRFAPSFLGRRRGWIFIMQLCLIATISAMAFSDPAQAPFAMAMVAGLVALSGAAQDIVIDAYRTEILQSEEFGIGAGIAIMGYRLAMIVSGAIALILADRMPWSTVYLLMAGLIAVGAVITVLAPEPKVKAKPPRTLHDAILLPFRDFFSRPGAVEILVFLTFYKLDSVFAMALNTKFMLDMGFSKTDIGTVSKGFGLVATIAGTLTGGVYLAKLGIQKGLWVFGIAQGLSGASFMVLARLGHNYPMMVTSIAVENFCSGMGTAAYSAFMMTLCNRSFTATQYALLTSVMALTRFIAGVPTGLIAEQLGWEMYFFVSILLAIPGLLMLLRYPVWMAKAKEPGTG